MAKKIRFPLQMKDGAAVRTLEELREHFDLESVLGYFADGKLKTWLADRYYNEMADNVAALTADMPDLNAKLCEIFGVEYSSESDITDLETLQRRQEKLRVLREVTDDQQILENVDAVAFDQDELFDILDEAPAVIYLYGDKFSIPFAKSGITYVGVNNPEVSLEQNELEYKKNCITLQRIRFANKFDAMTIEIANELIDQKRYDEALPIVKQLAEEGNAVAQSYLGRMYIKGIGVEKDDMKAVEWFRKAAEQGNAYAQRNLELMYRKILIRPEIRKALNDALNVVEEWYLKAAEQGNAVAQTKLGDLYLNGTGVVRDDRKAVEWFRKAAEQGNAVAQTKLGDLYLNGTGVVRDDRKAVEWFRKAAEQGDAVAQTKIGDMYLNGTGVVKDKKNAVEWFRKAAEQGDAVAQYKLGYMYYKGYGIEKSLLWAMVWARKSADQGNLDARILLGKIGR